MRRVKTGRCSLCGLRKSAGRSSPCARGASSAVPPASHWSMYGTSLPQACTSTSFAPNARQPPASATPAASIRIRVLSIAATLGAPSAGSRRAAGAARGGLMLDFSRLRRTILRRAKAAWRGASRPGDCRFSTPPTPMQVTLTWLDYLILLTYTCFVVGIGFALRKYMRSSSDFLTSGRSIPTWVTGLAFISANLGALELVGMAASGAKYGMLTSHFYWVGAIPAMVFLAVFMMPFYYGSKARSVPEYLKLRYDEKTRGLNAILFAIMTILASGISMYALAILMEKVLGWNFHLSLVLSAAIVLGYTYLGGLSSAIYNEVLQFFIIVIGLLPVVFLCLKDLGGWSGLQDHLAPIVSAKGFAADTWTTTWKY